MLFFDFYVLSVPGFLNPKGTIHCWWVSSLCFIPDEILNAIYGLVASRDLSDNNKEAGIHHTKCTWKEVVGTLGKRGQKYLLR